MKKPNIRDSAVISRALYQKDIRLEEKEYELNLTEASLIRWSEKLKSKQREYEDRRDRLINHEQKFREKGLYLPIQTSDGISN